MTVLTHSSAAEEVLHAGTLPIKMSLSKDGGGLRHYKYVLKRLGAGGRVV